MIMTKPSFGSGYTSSLAAGKLTLGIGVPLETYSSPVPRMDNQLEMVKLVEEAGFAVLWCRDVPLLDPSFGDAGQMYDPWVWLGYVAANTSRIALGTASIILPLRAPVDLAKAAASVDQLSDGRLLMGVASGDRPVEYSVYDVPFDSRDATFRDAINFIRETTHRPLNWNDQMAVQCRQVDLLPKSLVGDIPLLVTGNSRQTVDWIAEHSDGWLMYPRPLAQQTLVLKQWRESLEKNEQPWKPFLQSLYIDLTKDPDAPAVPIHLGFQLGRNTLLAFLNDLRDIGVNHVLFNIRFCTRPLKDVIAELAEYVVPEFPAL